MLNWVKGESKDFRETVNYHWIRKHKDKTVATELPSKTYQCTYTKRVIVQDGYSSLWLLDIRGSVKNN